MAKDMAYWEDYAARQKARSEAIRAADAGNLLGGKLAENIVNNPMLQHAANLPGAAGERARQIIAEQQAKVGGGAAAYDAQRQRIKDIRSRDVMSFDPYKAPAEDKYGDGRTSAEYLADMLEDQGILDKDGYTEDRRDKQGVDEFMDLFQPEGEQGRDTPPQWAFDEGAVPPDYNTDPSAGYGPGGYGPSPGGGGPTTPTGQAPGPAPGPPPVARPDMQWNNYVDAQSGNEDLYAQQANSLKNQGDQLMKQQYAAQQMRANPAAPQENPNPWDWVEGGLPQKPQAAQRDAEGDFGYSFAKGVTPGMTNREAFGAMEGRLSDAARGMLSEGFAGSDGDLVNFASGDHMDPGYYMQNRAADTSPEYQGALDEWVSSMYTRDDYTTPAGGGPTAAPGYALPVSPRGLMAPGNITQGYGDDALTMPKGG